MVPAFEKSTDPAWFACSARQTPIRIQARAVRRCGELLKTYNAKGARTDKPNQGAMVRSQKEAATKAGMSRGQRETAVRVANVPDFKAPLDGRKKPRRSGAE